MASGAGSDHGLEYFKGLDIFDGSRYIIERIEFGYHLVPVEPFFMLGHQLDALVEVTVIDAPDTADVNMLLIDLDVGIDGDIAAIGVLAYDAVSTVVTRH